jgi:hypothetical protein
MNRQTSKRINTINKIRAVLRDAQDRDVQVNYKRLIAIICLDENVSERKAKEYVNLLINSGECVREDGLIFLNKEISN